MRERESNYRSNSSHKKAYTTLKDREMNLHMVSIVLEKAYDKASGKVLWKCLEKKVVPMVYI